KGGANDYRIGSTDRPLGLHRLLPVLPAARRMTADRPVRKDDRAQPAQSTRALEPLRRGGAAAPGEVQSLRTPRSALPYRLTFASMVRVRGSTLTISRKRRLLARASTSSTGPSLYEVIS